MYSDLLNANTKLETLAAVEKWLETLSHDCETVSISYHAPEWLDVDPSQVEFQRCLLDELTVNCNAGAYRVSFRASYTDLLRVSETIKSEVDGVVSSIVTKGTVEATEDVVTGDVKVLVCPLDDNRGDA